MKAEASSSKLLRCSKIASMQGTKSPRVPILSHKASKQGSLGVSHDFKRMQTMPAMPSKHQQNLKKYKSMNKSLASQPTDEN